MKKNSKVIEREPLSNRNVDLGKGLDYVQIQERLDKGYVNDIKVNTSKSVGEILLGNIFTFFNLLCLLAFVWIISVADGIEDLKNTTFMLVIVGNTFIGIIQELKAKAKMDELSLLSSPDVKVIRDGVETTIKLNEIVVDDIIYLKAGNQICSDSVIKYGSVEVNESLLTGESMPVKKEVGDKLLSGSFVVSGNAQSQVENVGKDNYIQQLALKAKQFEKNKSELIRSIKLIMKVIGIFIIPMTILSFLNNFNAQLLTLNEESGIIESQAKFFETIPHFWDYMSYHSTEEITLAYKNAVTYTSASMIGMIPIGMFLLTSIALAVGILRLAKKKALVQDLYSIEALARVNMLCLDKTGTITDGTMNVREVIPINEDKKGYNIDDIIYSMQVALDENNQTAIALRAYFQSENIIKSDFVVPFSSDRKASAVKLKDIGICVLGAPEFITNKLSAKVETEINKYLSKGNRCLMLAINTTKIAANKEEIPPHSTPIALIVIEDNIKSEAIETIQMFKDNGVDVRVISGDNPITVSEVAKRAGIENAEKYLSLQNLSDKEIRTLAMDYTVFGRVNPNQKKLLVKIFKEEGHTVAMTGDGVNDILALKEADCSIAMANGSEATRNISQLVLLDSNFGSMPSIVKEGRRVINNVERAASLYLTKTVFSFFLLLSLILLRMSYPIEPVQLTFTSLFVIGFASFVLALEPNNNRIKGKFINNIMKNVFPPGLSIVVSVLVIMLLYKNGIYKVDLAEYQTVITYTIYGIFVLVLHNISKPYNVTRGILMIFVVTIGIVMAVVLPLLPNQSLNLYKLSTVSSLVSLTLLFSVVFLAENVIKIVDYIIKRYEQGVKLKGKKWSLTQGKIAFNMFKPQDKNTQNMDLNVNYDEFFKETESEDDNSVK